MQKALKAGVATIFALVLLTGCPNPDIPKEKSNEAPTVSLSATKTTIAIGETITITANADDDDGDSLSYSWYLDNEKSQVTDEVVTFTPASTGTYVIKCVVSDGEDSASDSITITVKSSTTGYGSVKLINNSGKTIAIFKTWRAGTDSSYGADLLSTTIPSGYNYTFTNIPAGAYYFYASTSDGVYYWANTDKTYTVEADTTFEWTLNP